MAVGVETLRDSQSYLHVATFACQVAMPPHAHTHGHPTWARRQRLSTFFHNVKIRLGLFSNNFLGYNKNPKENIAFCHLQYSSLISYVLVRPVRSFCVPHAVNKQHRLFLADIDRAVWRSSPSIPVRPGRQNHRTWTLDGLINSNFQH